MSLANSIVPVPSINPLMQFYPSVDYAVQIGNNTYTPANIQTQAYPQGGSGLATLTVNPSDLKTGIDRFLLIEWTASINFTGLTGLNGLGIQVGYSDALRFAPITHCMSSLSVNINNATFSLNINQVVDVMSRVSMSNVIRDRYLSCFPSALDTYQNFSDASVATTAMTNAYAQNQYLGAVNNPLAGGGLTLGKYAPPRGMYPVSVTNTAPGTNNPGVAANFAATVTFTTYEPLWISPFDPYADNFALIGINNITITANLQGLANAWCHDFVNPNAASTCVYASAALSAPKLHYTTLTPNLAIRIPPVTCYRYNSMEFYNNLQTIVAPSTSLTGAGVVSIPQAQSSTITFSNIPKFILVWAARQSSEQNQYNTNTFMRIKSAKITWDNITGILSSATSVDLFNESVRNGLQMNWNEWYNTVGGILILKVAGNLALQRPDEAPGMASQKVFKAELELENINTANVLWTYPVDVSAPGARYLGGFTPSVNVLAVYEGMMRIEAGDVQVTNSILYPTDTRAAYNKLEGEEVTVTEVTDDNFYGSGVGKFIKKLKKGHKFLRKHKPISYASNVARDLGYKPPSALEKVRRFTGYGYNVPQKSSREDNFDGGRLVQKRKLEQIAYDEDDDEEGDEEDYE